MKSTASFCCSLLFILIMSGCSKHVDIKLPAIFSDNLVLQQNSNAVIWGKATPGVEVTVSANWGSAATIVAGADSTWQLSLPTPAAGGSYTLSVTAGNRTRVVKNVLLGEVWLASGQSNMEMPLSGFPPHEPILYAEETIATANFPAIRMFTVANQASSVPMSDVTGSWEVASPETVSQFSATAYFFARKLHVELGVPIGIIHSSWGGTPAEAWVSGSKLASDEDFKAIIDKIDDLGPEEAAYQKWLESNVSKNIAPLADGTDPLEGIDVFNPWALDAELDATAWPVMSLPVYIEQTELGDFDGVIWFRKVVEIPAGWANTPLTLDLGPIDDRDVTWFNGQQVGATDTEGVWQQERSYNIPSHLVKPGQAVIAVRMVDNRGGGGIYGDASLLKIFPAGQPSDYISLAGDWNYKVVAEIKGNNLYLFDPNGNAFANRPERSLIVGSQTPSALFNGMIAPLVPFTIRGTIWYQGESNVGRANQYIRLKSMLVDDWRTRFNNPEMPFYWVQIAPWRYGDPNGTASAHLREAQRRLLAIPNTGMAVTLDVGDVNLIHPPNKLYVGERLARWALAHQYNRDIAFSGPIPQEVNIKGRELEISFSHVYDGLEIRTDVPNQFEIAGENGVFYSANAIIRNNSIVLTSTRVSKPVKARYAFRNGAQASLFNNAGLPASSFSTATDLND